MAVQMATSSTQDMINLGIDMGENAHVGKHTNSEPDAFADSAGNTQSFAKTLESMSRHSKRSEKTSSHIETVDADETGKLAALVEPAIKKNESLPLWTNFFEQENAEGDIEELMALIASREKKGRFDPDAILLCDLAPNLIDEAEQTTDELEASNETSGADEKTTTAQQADSKEAANLLAAQATAKHVEPDHAKHTDGLPVDPDAIDTTVPDTKPLHVKTSQEVIDTSPKNTDMTLVTDGEVDEADLSKASTSMKGDLLEGEDDIASPSANLDLPKDKSEMGRNVSEAPPAKEASQGDKAALQETQAASRVTAETGEKTEETAPEQKSTAKDSAQQIEDLIAKYKEERSSRDDNPSQGTFSKQPQRDRKSAAAAASAKNQRADTAAVPSTREYGQDVSKQTSFASDLGDVLKASKDDVSLPQATSAYRQGTAYTLNRELAFSDGVNTVLEFMRTDGTTEARIVVEPPALGHIDVSLRASSAGMEATFKVDNEHLKQVLQQQIDILKSSLESQGIHVSALAVDIRNKDDQKGREATYGNSKKSRGIGGVDDIDDAADTETSLVRLDLEKGLLHWVA